MIYFNAVGLLFLLLLVALFLPQTRGRFQDSRDVLLGICGFVILVWLIGMVFGWIPIRVAH